MRKYLRTNEPVIIIIFTLLVLINRYQDGLYFVLVIHATHPTVIDNVLMNMYIYIRVHVYIVLKE